MRVVRKKMDPDQKLHTFRRNLKWAWADLKKDLISGDGTLVWTIRFQLAALVLIILMAIAKFGFGLF